MGNMCNSRDVYSDTESISSIERIRLAPNTPKKTFEAKLVKARRLNEETTSETPKKIAAEL